MKTLQETIVDQLKAATWMNEPRAIGTSLVHATTALGVLTLLHDEHYPHEEAAADSMVGVSETMRLPLRLWRTQRNGYFFAHASLDASIYGCEAIASHHPINA